MHVATPRDGCCTCDHTLKETMTNLFTPTADGYDIQPAGVLILLAGYAREHQHIQRHIDSMLAAAREGGFTQGDILATLLAQGEVSHRVRDMAERACAAAGNEAIRKIFEGMRAK